jgi:hypothetical protein
VALVVVLVALYRTESDFRAHLVSWFAVVGDIANAAIIEIDIVNGLRINRLIIAGPQCF